MKREIIVITDNGNERIFEFLEEHDDNEEKKKKKKNCKRKRNKFDSDTSIARMRKRRKTEEEEKDKKFFKFFPECKKKPEREYKTKDVVRNKKFRERSMIGVPCSECEKFLRAAGADEKMIRECSRHRYEEDNMPSEPTTPEGFWNMDFFGEDENGNIIQVKS